MFQLLMIASIVSSPQGGSIMYRMGTGLLLLGMIIVFGSDQLFKRKKIQELQTLLKVKLVGLAVTVAGVLLLIYYF